MNTSKIKIKFNEIEIEYEGNETFLKNDLKELLENILSLNTAATVGKAEKKDKTDQLIFDEKIEMTTAGIAAKIDCKSGPDLVIAACAHLTLDKGINKIGRQSLIDEMRATASYFKDHYVGNLTTHIKSLLKANRLNEPSKNVYALTANEIKELRSKLA